MFSRIGNGFWRFLGGYRLLVLLISLWTSWGIIKSFFSSSSPIGGSQETKRNQSPEQQNFHEDTSHYNSNDDFER